MKKRLLAILKKNSANITGAVVIEALRYNNPHKYLLDVEQGLEVEILNTHEKINNFYNQYSTEIEKIKTTMQQYGKIENLPKLKDKTFLTLEAFKFIAFELYINLVIEDL